MDELEFVVEYRAGNQRVFACVSQPVEQLPHQLGHAIGLGCHVQDLAIAHHADAPAAIHAGMIEQAEHQLPVRGQQVVLVVRVPLG